MAVERGMMEEIDETESVEESVIEPITFDASQIPGLKEGDVVKWRVSVIDDEGIATLNYDTEPKKKGVRALADEYD